jgi:16S rRNA (guanine(966)-N(2))-methyltransferase RsmD
LLSPSGEGTRPTADRVREALFSIIAHEVSGADVLDGYAGTGAVGIEALSRGARSALFVESSRVVCALLVRNLEDLDLRGRSRVVAEPFERAALRLSEEDAAFDVVFLDPPYGPIELPSALASIASRRLLRKSGVLVAEHDARLTLPEKEGDLAIVRRYRYGGTALSLFRGD